MTPPLPTKEEVQEALRRGHTARTLPKDDERAKTLAADPNSYVRGQLAANPNLNTEIQWKLAGDKDRHVRRVLAHNPHTHPTVLHHLANEDWDEAVTKTAEDTLRDNSHTPKEADTRPTVL